MIRHISFVDRSITIAARLVWDRQCSTELRESSIPIKSHPDSFIVPSRPMQRDGLDGRIPGHCSSAVLPALWSHAKFTRSYPWSPLRPPLGAQHAQSIHCSALDFAVPASLSRTNRSSTCTTHVPVGTSWRGPIVSTEARQTRFTWLLCRMNAQT